MCAIAVPSVDRIVSLWAISTSIATTSIVGWPLLGEVGTIQSRTIQGVNNDRAVAKEAAIFWIGTEIQVEVAALEGFGLEGIVDVEVLAAQVTRLAGCRVFGIALGGVLTAIR